MVNIPEIPHERNVSEVLHSVRMKMTDLEPVPFKKNGLRIGDMALTNYFGNPVELRVINEIPSLLTGVVAEWQMTQRDFEDNNRYCHLAYVFGFDGTESVIIRRNNERIDLVTGTNPNPEDTATPVDRSDVTRKLTTFRSLFLI